ncbi:hypothetical protein [Microlunatus sp. Gsoil 973]|jgi:hypothetical protein|uniref:hypothetical protein n=1 Tax=Microlunatus sp. Gsoil 973 TaxID=2672569 RepID=UPI0012B48A4B|nr:hypothetical protein [Microlunatus sp. Gsoil 973]QGN32547.1 hypothetical protein GJV80_06755 [Microlunatus sp. Gsoil 973]
MEVPNHTSYRLVSRIAGVGGLVLVLLAFFGMDSGPFFSNAKNTEIIAWVHQHPTALYAEGLRTWLMMVMVAGFIGTLLWRTRRAGVVTSIVYGFLAANLAVDMVWSGVYYALAKAGQMGAPDAGVLSLFALAQEMTFTDGVWFGIALLAVSGLAARTRTLPRPVAWVGVGCAVIHLLGVPAQVLATGTVEGVTGPISAVVFMLWLLATALTLLIRPGQQPAAGKTLSDQSESMGDAPARSLRSPGSNAAGAA